MNNDQRIQLILMGLFALLIVALITYSVLATNHLTFEPAKTTFDKCCMGQPCTHTYYDLEEDRCYITKGGIVSSYPPHEDS